MSKIIAKALGKQWFAKHGIGRIAKRSIKPMENQHFCIAAKRQGCTAFNCTLRTGKSERSLLDRGHGLASQIVPGWWAVHYGRLARHLRHV